MPEVVEKCVKSVMKQGKSESSAYAICNAAHKKGKLDDDFAEMLSEIEEGSLEFDELMTYVEENALAAWKVPTKRKDVPASHFFDGKNKKYSYRNSDGTVNFGGVIASWKMANGANGGEKASSKIIAKIEPYRKSCKEAKPKSQSDQINNSILAFPFSFPEKVDLSSKKPVDIQILKQGKWRHPWYGILNFDSAFLNTMINNFNAGIPQDEISFDFNHQPDWGAACWVQKIFTANDGKDLMATVDLTKRGRQSIEDREFRFFSSSYRDNYVEHAFESGVDEKGNYIEKEFKISHGPTLLGGGLTNKPFIKGMKPVSLSEDGSQVIELTEVTETNNKSTNKEVDEKMKVKLSELEKEQKTLLDRIKELEAQEGGVTKKDLEEINESLSELSEKIKSATVDKDQEKKLSDLSEELNTSKSKVEELEKDLAKKEKDLAEKNKNTTKELEDVRKENKNLDNKVSALTETVTKLLEDRKVMAKEKFKINATTTVRELKDMGVFPATLKVIEPVLLSDAAEGIEIVLSEKVGDKDVKTKISLADMFRKVFESVPKEFRFSTSEDSESVITATGTTSTLSEEDVQKYANDNKLSYEDALIDLDKQGKL